MSVSAKMLASQLRGDVYPPDGVGDSPENRALWNQIGDEVRDMKARGVVPDVPWEYTDEGGQL